MIRVLTGLTAAALVGGLFMSTAVADDARTVRIEPRPFYGATVSVEAGVRVFRPLPVTKEMIIDSGRQPLQLTITEERKLPKGSE
jgi:hypothetical protein